MKQPILVPDTIEYSNVIFENAITISEDLKILKFKYSRGNIGYMAIKDGRTFNLTINIMDSIKYLDVILFKMWGEAFDINKKFIKEFYEVRTITVGVNRAMVCNEA